MHSPINSFFALVLGLSFMAGCSDKPEPAPEPPAPAPKAALPHKKSREEDLANSGEARQPRPKRSVLCLSGGTSHDFRKWFCENDTAGIAFMTEASVDYTERVDTMPNAILQHDVIVLSANQPLDGVTRQSIMSFVESGHGMVLIHPALWYNWSDWPEYNRVLVGGGTRDHDKYGDFIVTVEDPGHPVMKDLPASFHVNDELYHFERDEQGTPIQILATAKNTETGVSYPCVWVVKHPNGRIVCMTIGHDGDTHQNPNYHKLLKNSILWVTTK